MFLTLILARLNRAKPAGKSFSWSPALNLEDRSIYSALIPSTHY